MSFNDLEGQKTLSRNLPWVKKFLPGGEHPKRDHRSGSLTSEARCISSTRRFLARLKKLMSWSKFSTRRILRPWVGPTSEVQSPTDFGLEVTLAISCMSGVSGKERSI